MTVNINLHLELVKAGQYYLNSTRLAFDLPYAIYVVNGDSYKPYYRVHINGTFAGMFEYERQAEAYLLKLTKEQTHVFAIEDKPQRYKSFAVVFRNMEGKKTKMDIFSGKTEAEARSAFRECYRHGNYEILSTTEISD